ASQLALGKLDDARATFDKALQAAPGDLRAEAGKIAANYVGARAAGAAPPASDEANFDLLMSRALVELDGKNWVAARDQFLLAAETDPLRAARAWAALS